MCRMTNHFHEFHSRHCNDTMSTPLNDLLKRASRHHREACKGNGEPPVKSRATVAAATASWRLQEHHSSFASTLDQTVSQDSAPRKPSRKGSSHHHRDHSHWLRQYELSGEDLLFLEESNNHYNNKNHDGNLLTSSPGQRSREALRASSVFPPTYVLIDLSEQETRSLALEEDYDELTDDDDSFF